MTTQDDIFARPPRSARRRTPTPEVPTGLVRRTACAACGLRADVLLCRECLEDVPATRARVQTWIGANDTQCTAAFDVWDTFCQKHLVEWERMRAAERLPDYAARCARHRAAGNVYGQLLVAHAAYEHALAPLSIERDRLERALQILGEL